jgi:hypothetical protein
MLMTEGQIYQCVNRDCGCQVRVVRESIESDANPRCCCGAEMKKPYQKPIVRPLGTGGKHLATVKAERNKS